MNKPIKNKKILIYQDGKFIEQEAGIPVEMPAQFIINDREILKMMVTPINLREFAIGFLAGQGFIETMDDIKTELIGQKKAVLYFEIKKDIMAEKLSATAYLNPGCGGGVSFKSIDLPKVKQKKQFKINDLLDLMKKMLTGSTLYKKSGGFHTAALCVEDKLTYLAEDVGRHNAVDKVIGSGFIDGIDFSDSSLLSTGRITFEAVAKASRLGIPVLISRSSPTNLAVSLAEKQGITLIGYARGNNAKIYSCSKRLI